MQVNVSKYLLAYPGFVSFSNLRHDMTIDNIINTYAAITGCPLIAVCYMAIKKFGDSEEIQKKIKNLTDFYHYDSIIGVSELLEGEINE